MAQCRGSSQAPQKPVDGPRHSKGFQARHSHRGGGYCSGPTLKAAQRAGIPTLIQEQNSYAGVTNKLLAEKADRICVAYDGMERFFPADKIVKTGNPVRTSLTDKSRDRNAAIESFGLNPDKPTLLVVGGSLGALTINESFEGDWKKYSMPDFSSSGRQARTSVTADHARQKERGELW